MKHAKPARHTGRNGRWSEDWHVTIGVGVTVLIIATLVVGLGYAPPLSPEKPASSNRSVMGPR